MAKTTNRLPITEFVITILVLWLAYSLSPLYSRLLLAALLAYLLNPIVSLIVNRSSLPRERAAFIVFLVFLVALLAGIFFLTPVVLNQARALSGALQSAWDLFPSLVANLNELVVPDLPIESIISDVRGSLYQIFSTDRAFRLIQSTTSNIFWLIVVLLLGYYLLRDWPRLRDWLYGLAPANKHKQIRLIHDQLKNIWQAYLRGHLLVMIIVGSLSGGAAFLLGLPGALLLGIIAGLLNIIPSLGPAVATAMAVAVAWTRGSAFLPLSNEALIIPVIICFVGIQVLENVWIFPRVVGHKMNLHPGLILVTVIAAFTLSGTLMALVAVPLVATADMLYGYLKPQP